MPNKNNTTEPLSELHKSFLDNFLGRQIKQRTINHRTEIPPRYTESVCKELQYDDVVEGHDERWDNEEEE